MRTMLVALAVTMMFVVTGCEDTERRAKRAHEYQMELLKRGYYKTYGTCIRRLVDVPVEDPNTVK